MCDWKQLSLASPRQAAKPSVEWMTVIKSMALQIKVTRGSAEIVLELLYMVSSLVCVVVFLKAGCVPLLDVPI